MDKITFSNLEKCPIPVFKLLRQLVSNIETVIVESSDFSVSPSIFDTILALRNCTEVAFINCEFGNSLKQTFPEFDDSKIEILNIAVPEGNVQQFLKHMFKKNSTFKNLKKIMVPRYQPEVLEQFLLLNEGLDFEIVDAWNTAQKCDSVKVLDNGKKACGTGNILGLARYRNMYQGGNSVFEFNLRIASSTDMKITVGVCRERNWPQNRNFAMKKDGFGFDLQTGQKIQSGRKKAYGATAKVGDFITVVLDMEVGSLTIKINGVEFALAFQSGDLRGGEFFPAAYFENSTLLLEF